MNAGPDTKARDTGASGRTTTRSAVVRHATLAALLALSALSTGASCGNDGIPPPNKRECIDDWLERNVLFSHYTCAYWGRCRVPNDPRWYPANRFFDIHRLETTQDCRERFDGRDMFGLGDLIQDNCLIWDCFDAMVNAPCDRPPIEDVCRAELGEIPFGWQEFPLECLPAFEGFGLFLERCQPHDESVFWWRQ